MKRSNKKGFTLAELLIVIAIIAILVAIMIPVFGAQLNKAIAATELANVRAAYAEELANAMMSGSDLTSATSGAVVTAEKLEAALTQTRKDDITIILEIAPVAEVSTTNAAGVTTVTTNAARGKITVTYKGISGSFEIDSDVQITKGGTALTTNGAEIWKKA